MLAEEPRSKEYEHAIVAAFIAVLIVSWRGSLDVGYFVRVVSWFVLYFAVLAVTYGYFHD
jgi:hypothetical protein